VLDPAVAEVFHNSQDVNAVLRALLRTMPATAGKAATASKKPGRKSRR
jgi:hypothetical protein